MSSNILFMIEGGKALELVKAHIANKKTVRTAVPEMATELGIEVGVTSRLNGNLIGVVFPGDRHLTSRHRTAREIAIPRKIASGQSDLLLHRAIKLP